METIICLITHNNYYETRYCIENFSEKTSLPFRLHILDNNSSDKDLVKYLEKITKDIKKGFLYRQEKQLSLPECYNLLLTTCGENNCVFFPVNCLVDYNWLEDMLYGLQSIKKCGFVGIRPVGAKIDFSPVLKNSLFSEEDLLENAMQVSDMVNSVVCIKPELLKTIGRIDNDLNATGFEIAEFALRAKVNGFANYYVRKQSAFKMPFKNEILFPKITDENVKKFKETVNLMFKHKRFKK